MQTPSYFIETLENYYKIALGGPAGSKFNYVDVIEQFRGKDQTTAPTQLRFTRYDVEYLLQILPLMLNEMQYIE